MCSAVERAANATTASAFRNRHTAATTTAPTGPTTADGANVCGQQQATQLSNDYEARFSHGFAVAHGLASTCIELMGDRSGSLHKRQAVARSHEPFAKRPFSINYFFAHSSWLNPPPVVEPSSRG